MQSTGEATCNRDKYERKTDYERTSIKKEEDKEGDLW